MIILLSGLQKWNKEAKSITIESFDAHINTGCVLGMHELHDTGVLLWNASIAYFCFVFVLTFKQIKY